MKTMKRMLAVLSAFILFLTFSPGAVAVDWKAHWIMHPTVQPQEHAVIIFRKTIELQTKPEKFIIHLSADNHYRLFVNVNYVLRGTARGDLSHWFYETIDIAPYMICSGSRGCKLGTKEINYFFLTDDFFSYAE